MRRAVALLSLLLLLLPVVAADEKVIHEDWHPYQDFFTIGEDYYEVINDHRLDGDRVRIQTLIKRNQASYIITAIADEPDDDALYTLANETCKAEGTYRFCVKDISFDPANEARSDEAGRYRYGTYIKIYEDIPETAALEITKTFGKTSLFYEDEVKVEVVITNKGTIKATNIEYNETAGKGLLITRHDGYDHRLTGKLKKAVPELYPGQQASMKYWIKAIDYVNKTDMQSSITYEDPDPATVSKTDQLTVTWPYAASFALGAKETDINKAFPLTYTLTNNDNDPLEALLSITLDNGIIVDDVGDFQRAGNKLLYEGTIPPESSESLTADILSRFTGTYNVSTDLGLSINGYSFAKSTEDAYTVRTDTITPSIVLSKNKMRLGEPVTIGFYLKNEDDENAFFNIQGWAGSDFFNQSFALEALAKEDEENIIFKPYYPPGATNDIVDHVIAMGGTFQTQNGERQSFYTERTITVIPKNMSILLTKTIAPASLKRGEEVTVTVEAENVADSGSNFVQAHDEYDDGLEKSFGSTRGETFLYPGESRQLYVYKLRVPYDYTKGNFTITSLLTAQGQALTKKADTVTVTDPLDPSEVPPQDPEEPEDPEESVEPDEPVVDDPELPDEPGETPGEPEAAKEGVFKRIISGIADFFANFFS